MYECNAVSTPMVLENENTEYNKEFEDNNLYRQVIRTLLFLSNSTRPDISFSVCYLSRFVEKPSKGNWIALNRILRYLKGIINFGLRYKYGDHGELIGYSDASYANNLKDRKSTTGFVGFYNG